MDENKNANSSEPPTSSRTNQTYQENDDASITSKELVTHIIDFTTSTAVETGRPISTLPTSQNDKMVISIQPKTSIPLLIFSRTTSCLMQNTDRPLENDPKPPISFVSLPNQPQSLFLLTLAKLNESSISLAISNNRQITSLLNSQKICNTALPEPSPPNSLTSAPPSYSFVLRQMNARRRPRLMGTFIPSPSFVQHSPPPNYAAAFDIYMDNTLPPPPTRAYHFGFTPTPVICTECGYTGMTLVRTKVTLCTHLCAFILCLLCCWICAPLPYVLRSCKDVYHYCRNCRNYLGMYCPTNPDNSYS
ncbi:unnamed protein product [Leptosia nina]|uniref:LITAF domain-containing protein n=1 Tax=Leptosia nina TaxID=320188 RepID=A0AAV1JYV2_9NEOP